MRKLLLFLLMGAFGLIMGLTLCSAEEATLDSIKVSVDFKSDTDLKYALQIISVLTGLSIIPDDDVTGKVTARFIDQPVSKVLERILEVNDCEYKLVDDIIRVVRIPVISKIFPLKFALASDMGKVIKIYLSPEGILEVDEERNELTVTDASYYLEKVGALLANLDSPEKQMKERSFSIKYARIENLALLLRENLSPEGTLEVDEERSLISIEDTSYHLFKLERLIQKEDSFIPKKKRYWIRFAPLTIVAEKAEEILSDKGILEIEEDTSSFLVSDVVKNLEKIEKLVGKIDKLEDWVVRKTYPLKYYTPEEARLFLQDVITSYGEIRLPRVLRGEEQSQEEEEFILIPREEPAPREAVSERVLAGQLSETASEKLPSLEESEAEDNVIYVTDLKRNIPNIDALITYLNGAETAAQIITKTFYIKEGSLERMALAMANILGISPDDIEGLDPKGEWMQMEVPTLEINLGTIGPK